ncbi:hypothetical protein TraAM80_03950 [Trypanosoma rangeli]|uniref:Uncharacterized protein n=1 Tax=Trypanosoma rangeli TaxID=5698 RepID=A0A3S5IRF3_TRYRA|nr:uncharacterized protein TraAM80_03950 [Trypanosoma rangeli]RNF06377.1 hypothetical protein TraAM80_03950 [Trypanosoma rangeli]|eukprot:RNF06377.1 hypothetical protein TraAM80_03950 [Trypanosoma rangeli]
MIRSGQEQQQQESEMQVVSMDAINSRSDAAAPTRKPEEAAPPLASVSWTSHHEKQQPHSRGRAGDVAADESVETERKETDAEGEKVVGSDAGQAAQNPQQQSLTAGVVKHRVFTEEELAAYMEQQRQREREEEVRHTKLMRNSVLRGSSRLRGSKSGASSMRIPPIDANAAHLSQLQKAQQQLFTTATVVSASSPAGVAMHPLVHQLPYAGTSLPPANVDASMRPYSNFFAPNVAPPLNIRPPHQQQLPHTLQPPSALCPLWGVQPPSQPQYMGLPQPCATPPMFNPSAIMRMDQPHQLTNEPSPQFLNSAQIPNTVQGSILGLSMQELEVLVRLIVLARNEQQHQQQYQFPQKQPAQPPQYCYYQEGKQKDVGSTWNSFNT